MLIVFNSVKSKQQTKLTVPVKYTSAKVWNPVDDTETDLGDGSISLGEYLVKFVQITF